MNEMIIQPQDAPLFIIYGIAAFFMFGEIWDGMRERLAYRVSRCERRRIVLQQMKRRRRAARIR